MTLNRCNRTYHILNAWRPSMRNSCSFAMFFSSISLHCLIFAGASASCDRTELLQHVTRQGGSQRPLISRSKSLVQRVTGGHSKHRRPPTNRTEAGLREVAEYLRRAKGECLRSSVECLPALKQVRFRAWFFLQDLVRPRKKSWPLLDLHPQVFHSRCTGLSNNSILFLDLSTSASATTRASLEAMSDFQVVKAFEDDVHWCENLHLHEPQPETRVFTLVQDPLDRFMAAYADMDADKVDVDHSGSYEFLHLEGLERAKAFMEKFIKFGDQFSSHVKPQSEHLAPVSGDCALKLDFIGKSERFEEDWIAFFQAQRCASEPRPPAQLVSAAQAKRSTSTAAIRAALDAENSAYLRAFCWIHLADYVIFDYDLPNGCDEEEMLKIMALAKQKDD